MTKEELMEIWHNKPENKNLGARKSAIKFAEYYHQEQVKAGVTSDERDDITFFNCYNCGSITSTGGCVVCGSN